MASVLRHLFETMPMFAAAPKSHHVDATLEPYASTPITAFKKIKMLGNGPMSLEAPPVPMDSRWTDDQKQRDEEVKKAAERQVWSFQHDSARPNVVTQLACRVRETGYKNYLVADSIEWGYEKDGKLKPHVLAILKDGKTEIELPLDTAHMYARFLVDGGHLSSNEMPAFPLETMLDKGLVVAFAYEIDDKGKVQPYKPGDKDEGDKALQLGYMGYCNEEGWTAWAEDEQGNRWIDRALKGSFMDLPATQSTSKEALFGSVGEKRVIVGKTERVLVVISLSAAKERADFEPKGVVGMTRFYPHLMFRASFPVSSVRASARFKRPKKSTIFPEKDGKSQGNGTVPGVCCGALSDIGSLLVADNNEDWFALDMYYLPFWSGLFAYYATDPDQRWKGQALRIVDRSKLERVTGPYGKRDTSTFPDVSDATKITKVALQGQFDNIHVAPRLKLNATHVKVLPNNALGTEPEHLPILPDRMKIEAIAMAPFCSHDCFHMHWRWSATVEDDATWTFGFQGDQPYAKKGAPLVPATHNVDLTSWGPAEFTYSESAHGRERYERSPGDWHEVIPPLTWETFCYAGGAYAQAISDWRMQAKVKFRMNMCDVQFSRQVGVTLRGPDWAVADLDDPPVFYWNMRYFYEKAADGQLEAKEWLSFTKEELDIVRKA